MILFCCSASFPVAQEDKLPKEITDYWRKHLEDYAERLKDSELIRRDADLVTICAAREIEIALYNTGLNSSFSMTAMVKLVGLVGDKEKPEAWLIVSKAYGLEIDNAELEIERITTSLSSNWPPPVTRDMTKTRAALREHLDVLKAHKTRVDARIPKT